MQSTETRSPDAMSAGELIAHIAGRYQDAHRRSLPDLIVLARKVERVHAAVAEAPIGLADALDALALDLDLHMQAEEKVLFGAAGQDVGGALAHPIAVMRGEHRHYAKEIERVREIAHGFVPPIGACGSWRRLYAGVAELCALLQEQIRLEDEVLFPRFERGQTRCTCSHG